MSGTTKTATDIERVQNFVNGVLDGSIPSCKMVRRAVERFMDDLKRKDLYFDQAIFGKFCKFSRQFKHYKGALAGQFFEPEDWQLFVFANCIGLRRVSSGRRKYRLADIYLPVRPSSPQSSPCGFCSWTVKPDRKSTRRLLTRNRRSFAMMPLPSSSRALSSHRG